ncbi:MAG: hypothetical protein IKV57_05985 [Clostridia bacterium]|nr:hypothetical protein [Clostridia bacterium]
MQELVKALDEQPQLLKIILALPGLDIIWGIYRICRSLGKKNMLGLAVSIVLLFVSFMWVIDIVMILAKGNVWSMD